MTTVTIDIPEHLIPLINSIGTELPLVLEMGMSRLAPVSTKAYMEAVALLTQHPDPKTVAEFRFSEDVESRIVSLLERNRADQITKSEEVELDRLIQLEEQLQIVKAKAQIELNY
ncbi:MAG: hypothetical protein KDE48_11355 [Anaerolineales bacterium]|nr:hypothetical protein [Anaerolineales bacterium]